MPGLTKRYHRKTALPDVSFTIGRGEVPGLEQVAGGHVRGKVVLRLA